MLEKLLAKLREHFSECPCFKEGGCLCAEVNSDKIKPVKLPVGKLIFSPFSLLFDNGKNFFLLALPVALAISLIAMPSGFGYMCIYSQIAPVTAHCSNSGFFYLLYGLAKVFLWAVFAVKWCEISFRGQPFEWKSLLKADRRVIKLALALILVIVLNFLPMVSGWVLYLREPNPDWRIEMAFFSLMSVGFVIPFVVLRFYSVLAFIINGEKVPPLKEIWYKTVGDTLVILMSLFFVFIVAVFIFGNLYQNFQSVAAGSSFYVNFASEMIYNLISLMVLTIVINNFYLQKQILFAETEGEYEQK